MLVSILLWCSLNIDVHTIALSEWASKRGCNVQSALYTARGDDEIYSNESRSLSKFLV